MIMKRIFFIMITIIGLAVDAYASNVELNPEKTRELYQKAYEELVPIPEDIKSIVSSVLKEEWKPHDSIDQWVEANEASIKLFKQATAGQSDGWLFAPKPKKLTFDTYIPDYQNEIRLLQLLLLQARNYQIESLHDKAKENYLAAASFLVHFSDEDLNVLIPKLIEIIMFKHANAAFLDSLDSDQNYLNQLNGKLNEIKNNQDHMEQTIRQEYSLISSVTDYIEKELEKGNTLGKTFRDMFVLSDAGPSKKSVLDNFNLSKKHNDQYLSEMNRLFTKELSLREEMLVSAFKNNDFDDYNKHYAQYKKEITENLENLLLYVVKKLWFYKGRMHLVLADISTQIILSISDPNYEKAGKKYWDYYAKLENLVDETSK